LEPEHVRVITVVYTSALLPLVLIPILAYRGIVPSWVPRVYVATFLACAVGWELWFTYGWWDGDPVHVRRAADLNAAIPTQLNWVLNSLADAGAIALFGVWLIWRSHGRNSAVLRRWTWSAFGVLMFWFLFQNIYVEMFLYHDQLSEGKPLSWAPLAPTGPWWNPTLFTFRDRTITLQGQIPWLMMGPMFYYGLTRFLREHDSIGGDGTTP